MRVSKIFNNSVQSALILYGLASDKKSVSALGENEAPHLQNAREFFDGLNTIEEADPKRLDFTENLLEAFAAHTDPTYQKNENGQGSGAYIGWISKIYAQSVTEGTPIPAEDLYKVKEELEYFHAAKSHIKSLGHSPDIGQYQTYEEFQDVVDPLMLRRDQKNEIRGMTNAIKESTTVLYDGAEGKVVIPHNVQSARFWGQITKWCISGKNAHEHYPDYNNDGPIVMYAPKTSRLDDDNVISGKVATADNQIFNERDKRIDGLPAYIKPLHDATVKSLESKGERAYFQMFSTPNENLENLMWEPRKERNLVTPTNYDSLPQRQQLFLGLIINAESSNREHMVKGIFERFPDLSDDREFIRAGVQLHEDFLNHANDTIKNDREVVLTAVKNHPWALQSAAPKFQDDFNIVLAAVQEQGWTLEYASPRLKKDTKIVQAAIEENGTSLEFADHTFRQDPRTVLAAFENNPKALQYADERVFDDLNFVQDVLNSAQKGNEATKLNFYKQMHRMPVFQNSLTTNFNELQSTLRDAKKMERFAAPPNDPPEPA